MPSPSASAAVTLLLVHAQLRRSSAEGRVVRDLIEALEHIGVTVTSAESTRDAEAFLQMDADIDMVVADWDLPPGAGSIADMIALVRERRERVPIWLMADRTAPGDLPAAVLGEVDEFVYLLDDTVEWIAGRLRDGAARYRESMLPVMFKALMQFAQTHEYSWHTPGHEGGAAFRKTAPGRAFFDFFGEQMFRSDLSISVAELGSLLDHSGPIGAAERNAARIFGADLTLFVTNGTSTSNRVVHQACVTAGDVVLDDRNAHKSTEQADTITHAVPIYLIPTRNRYGIIGPIPPDEMTAAAIAAKIAASPLAADDAAPVLATVTNSTYDGLLYHVPTVERALGSQVDRIHFDEAWYGYAAFNPIYRERHALHTGERDDDGPTVFATQSTHKLLAALSQASYIHVRNGRRPITQPRLNEAFMMHASTSPLYSIIASNDVAATMMEGRSGLVLTTDSLRQAVDFRKALTRFARDLGDDWFFRCWQPDEVTDPADGSRMPFADAPDDLLVGSPEPWLLRRGEDWHGFDLPDGYAMLDPIKVTVLTPGVTDDGALDTWGIPAALVTAYLDAKASIIVEKTQDFSMLFLFSMGVTKGKWGSLLTTLSDFKRDWDANMPVADALPGVFAAHSEAYAGMGLADLGRAMFETMRETDQLAALHRAFAELPTPVMTNADAYATVVRGTIESVTLDQAAGRVCALGVVPYPPGIPLIMPGESIGASDGPSLSYLRSLQEFDRRFPGFEHDLHGVHAVGGDYVLTVVAGEAAVA